MRIIIALVLTACHVRGEYQCTSHDECRRGDELGFCERSGYCTFSDTSCPSQRRYAESAPADIADRCLEGIVTGTFHNAVVTNDATFAPVITDQPPRTISLSASLEDGTSVAVDYRGDGAFSFPATGWYEVVVIADGFGWTYQHTAPHLELDQVYIGRVDRGHPPMAQTDIQFMYAGPGEGTADVASTGLWTETGVGGSTRNLSFDWRKAVSQFGPLGLLDAAQNDRLYYVEITAGPTYSSITSYAASSVTLREGMVTMVTGDFMANVAPDRCVHVTNAAADDLAALKTAFPSISNPTGGWLIESVPARARTIDGQHSLAYKYASPPVNSDVMASFPNPYPGTELLALTDVLAEGSAGLPNAVSNAVLPFALLAYSETNPSDASCNERAMLSASVGLYGKLQVQGTDVTKDNQALSLDASPRIELKWARVGDGPAHFFAVLLYELSDDGAGATVKTGIAVVVTTDRRALFQRYLFQNGHTYILEIQAHVSRPDAAAGDFVKLQYPVGVAQTWTHSFTVN